MNIYEILILSVVISLFITGLREASTKGYLLNPIAVWMEDKLPDIFYKIILDCYKCTSSFWSAILFGIYWYISDGQALDLLWLLIIIPVVCALNTVLYLITEVLRSFIISKQFNSEKDE